MASSTSRQGGAPDSAAAVMSDRVDALVSELTAEETALVSAASSLVPVLSANAQTADATRRLPEEDVKALREAGLFRLATPRAYGGHEAGACAGMGMAVYDHIVEKLTDGRPLTSGARLHARAVDAPGVQANVADAAMLIDSAILQAARSARAVDSATRTGARMTPLATARIRMDAGFAGRQVRQAVDKLLDVGGASRFAESSPAQRIWRDLGTATRHPAFVTEIDRERYARLLLGINGQ